MRYIDKDAAIASVDANILSALETQNTAMSSKSDAEKKESEDKGNDFWSPIKPFLARVSHQKCWYTESTNLGSDNDVEHFRPKGRVSDKQTGNQTYWYWFLTFDPENYRFSCAFSNQYRRNPETGTTGGKGTLFPLLNDTPYANDKTQLINENPVLLDPCNQTDVSLLAFQADGRPVLSPEYENDPVARKRVEMSNILLNLDYPVFNEARKNIYNSIYSKILRGDEHFKNGNAGALEDVINDLKAFMALDAQFSKAAECYIKFNRDRAWINELFQ